MLGNLSQLQYLELGFNKFNIGFIPQSIGKLRRLKNLGLSDNRLSGPILQTISNLSLLEGIYLQNTHLSGT
jgi:Leucine-rich repeat (LRR) protein